MASKSAGTTVRTGQSAERIGRAGTATYLTIALECEHPGCTPHRFMLDASQQLLLGRSEAFTHAPLDGARLFVGIDDTRLSRQHALIGSQDGSEWLLRDLGSTNGTYHNGVRVTQIPLKSSDVIQCGRTILIFHSSSSGNGAAVRTPRLDEEPGFVTLNPDYELVLERLKLVASASLPVLLQGESGTGKEVTARGIHRLSARPGPFVALNCGALSSGLAETQLFGHVRGAFSGALKDEPGFVRAAQFGTLFLDEIAELTPAAQVLLLRVLEEKEVTPVGAVKGQPVDVRIVAATHQPLARMVEEGRFRRDLFGRLSGYVHVLPPLRDRREDLGWFIGTWQRQHADLPWALRALRTKLALELFRHDWPLNVRELMHFLSSACIVAQGEPLGVEHWSLRQSASLSATHSVSKGLTREDQKLRTEIVELVRQHRGNLAAVGRSMGKARQQIQRWVGRLGIDLSEYRS